MGCNFIHPVKGDRASCTIAQGIALAVVFFHIVDRSGHNRVKNMDSSSFACGLTSHCIGRTAARSHRF